SSKRACTSGSAWRSTRCRATSGVRQSPTGASNRARIDGGGDGERCVSMLSSYPRRRCHSMTLTWDKMRQTVQSLYKRLASARHARLRCAIVLEGLSFLVRGWRSQRVLTQEACMEPATTVLLDGLVFPEGPRWHDGKLWFSDIFASKVMAVDLDGHADTIV